MAQRRSLSLMFTLLIFVIATFGCSTASPVATLQEMVTAMKNKDIKTYKATMSARKMLFWEKEARQYKKSVDEHIAADQFEASYIKGIPDPVETRGESIEGNSATIHWNTGFEWVRVKFVKEDGKWKFDELLKADF